MAFEHQCIRSHLTAEVGAIVLAYPLSACFATRADLLPVHAIHTQSGFPPGLPPLLFFSLHQHNLLATELWHSHVCCHEIFTD
jgi:hypothetical protein